MELISKNFIVSGVVLFLSMLTTMTRAQTNEPLPDVTNTFDQDETLIDNPMGNYGFDLDLCIEENTDSKDLCYNQIYENLKIEYQDSANFFDASISEVDGPVIIGNGGDTVFCRVSDQNNFRGFYSLDYLMTYKKSNDNRYIFQPRDLGFSLERIANILADTNRDLHYNFVTYVNLIRNDSDFSQKYIWNEAGFGLRPIHDEHIIQLVPRNCFYQDNTKGLQIIQTVIRRERDQQTVFYYHPEILAQLEKLDPLQASFLLVHEWLWNLTNDVTIVRDVNWYLHSDFAQRDGQVLNEVMNNFGITPIGRSFLSICKRTSEIRDEVVSILGRGCEDISREEIESITELTPNGYLGEIKPGDFTGFRNLKSIDLSFGSINHLYDFQFNDQVFLEKFNAKRNNIGYIPSSLYHRKKFLRSIDLSNNVIRVLPVPLLKLPTTYGFRGELLNLSYNKIREIPFAEYSKEYGYCQIDLSNNDIVTLDNVCNMLPFGDECYLDLRGNSLNGNAINLLRRCNDSRILFE